MLGETERPVGPGRQKCETKRPVMSESYAEQGHCTPRGIPELSFHGLLCGSTLVKSWEIIQNHFLSTLQGMWYMGYRKVGEKMKDVTTRAGTVPCMEQLATHPLLSPSFSPDM